MSQHQNHSRSRNTSSSRACCERLSVFQVLLRTDKTHACRISEKQRALHGFAQQSLSEAERKPSKLTVSPAEFKCYEQAER